MEEIDFPAMEKIVFPHEDSILGYEIISNDPNGKGEWPTIKLVAKDQSRFGELATILPLVASLDEYPDNFQNCDDIVSNLESLTEILKKEVDWIRQNVTKEVKIYFSSTQD